MASFQQNMQLFQEMRQKFPELSERDIQQCIFQNSGDREKCLNMTFPVDFQREDSRYFPSRVYPSRSPSYPSPNYQYPTQQQQHQHGRASDPGITPLRVSTNPHGKVPYYAQTSTPPSGSPVRHISTLEIPSYYIQRMTPPKSLVRMTPPPHQHHIDISIMPGYRLFQEAPDLQGHAATTPSPRMEDLRRSMGTPEEEHAYIQALLVHQKARLDLLRTKYENSREMLKDLKVKVYDKERELYKTLQRNTSVEADETQKLHKDITKLRVECHCLSMEVDVLTKEPVPLGVTDEDFYHNIFTGQTAQPQNKSLIANSLIQSTATLSAPGIPSSKGVSQEEEELWKCGSCTFENHPALNKCEICEAERIGGEKWYSASNGKLQIKITNSNGFHLIVHR